VRLVNNVNKLLTSRVSECDLFLVWDMQFDLLGHSHVLVHQAIMKWSQRLSPFSVTSLRWLGLGLGMRAFFIRLLFLFLFFYLLFLLSLLGCSWRHISREHPPKGWRNHSFPYHCACLINLGCAMRVCSGWASSLESKLVSLSILNNPRPFWVVDTLSSATTRKIQLG